jgi:hypothetical protein
MEPIDVKETPKTPMIRYEPENHKIIIKGKSIPEDPRDFFSPVLAWFEDYASNPPDHTQIDIKLEYFNTSSSKTFLQIFKKLEDLHKKNKDVEINWYYEVDDYDMKECGEDYRTMLSVPFKMIEVLE